MLHERNIKFIFKDRRNYVQGPDIYDGILETVKDLFEEYPIEITGSFHRLLNTNGICRIYHDSDEIKYEGTSANFSFKLKNKTYHATILDSYSTISSRREYDEKQIIKGHNVNDNCVALTVKSNYSYMEQIVAITKLLHLHLYPEASGKWLFTKIQIRDFTDPIQFIGHQCKVFNKRHFNYILTQNSIYIDNTPIGNIWFSLQK